jgi:fluoroacetyl-CoA thioesterase
METHNFVKVGMKKESTFTVEEKFTASHVGSGSLRVLATPSMIAFMEITARSLLEEVLPDGYSSVGVHVDVRHLAPTPLGGQVRVVCEVVEVEAQQVRFAFQAQDGEEKIGDGSHKRVVIDVNRFLKRIEAKSG